MATHAAVLHLERRQFLLEVSNGSVQLRQLHVLCFELGDAGSKRCDFGAQTLSLLLDDAGTSPRKRHLIVGIILELQLLIENLNRRLQTVVLNHQISCLRAILQLEGFACVDDRLTDAVIAARGDSLDDFRLLALGDGYCLTLFRKSGLVVRRLKTQFTTSQLTGSGLVSLQRFTQTATCNVDGLPVRFGLALGCGSLAHLVVDLVVLLQLVVQVGHGLVFLELLMEADGVFASAAAFGARAVFFLLHDYLGRTLLQDRVSCLVLVDHDRHTYIASLRVLDDLGGAIRLSDGDGLCRGGVVVYNTFLRLAHQIK